jgi:hypothetical protein
MNLWPFQAEIDIFHFQDRAAKFIGIEAREPSDDFFNPSRKKGVIDIRGLCNRNAISVVECPFRAQLPDQPLGDGQHQSGRSGDQSGKKRMKEPAEGFAFVGFDGRSTELWMVLVPGLARSLIDLDKHAITGRIDGNFYGVLLCFKGQKLDAIGFIAVRFDFIAKFDEASVKFVLEGID